MVESIFLQILGMSITASIVILAVLLVRLFLKKAPRVFSYALWAVVLFRLLCPVTVETSFGVITGSFPKENAWLVNTDSIADDKIQDNTSDGNQPHDSSDNPEGNSEKVGTVAGTIAPQTFDALLDYLIPVLTVVWSVGVIVLFLRGLIQYIKLRRRLAISVPSGERIYLADHISTPFVMGVIAPEIYLPSTLSEEEREYILLHEQHHIRRGDHVWRLLAFLTLCVHWFNPLVWLAFVLSGRDMEQSCDEAVLKKLGTDVRSDYAESLLKFSGNEKLMGMPVAFGENDVKRRIQGVLNFKKPSAGILVAGTVLVAVAGAMLLVNGREKNQKVLGAEYEISKVLYHAFAEEKGDAPFEHKVYCVSGDYQLYVRAAASDGNVYITEETDVSNMVGSFTYLGKLEAYPLTKELLYSYFLAPGEEWRAKQISEITDAYICRSSANDVTLIMQTKNGKTYISGGTGTVENIQLSWLCEVTSTMKPNAFDAGFVNRSLTKVFQKNVDAFYSWSNVHHPGYQVVGFTADGSEAKSDFGFAVFREYEFGGMTFYKLLDAHLYEDAEIQPGGIYIAEHPAVLNEEGVITDETAFDVILSHNEKLDSIVWELDDGTMLKAENLSEWNMELISWEKFKKSKVVKIHFYDEFGEEIVENGQSELEKQPVATPTPVPDIALPLTVIDGKNIYFSGIFTNTMPEFAEKLEKAEYFGTIVSTVLPNTVPSAELESNCFDVGDQIYIYSEEGETVYIILDSDGNLRVYGSEWKEY